MCYHLSTTSLSPDFVPAVYRHGLPLCLLFSEAQDVDHDCSKQEKRQEDPNNSCCDHSSLGSPCVLEKTHRSLDHTRCCFVHICLTSALGFGAPAPKRTKTQIIPQIMEQEPGLFSFTSSPTESISHSPISATRSLLFPHFLGSFPSNVPHHFIRI